MSQYDSKVQNLYLSQIRKKHQKIEVVLETGNVLRGKLKAYDQFSVTLAFKEQVEVVYRSSIIYITAIPSLPEKKPFRGSPRGSYASSNRYNRQYEDYNDNEKTFKPHKHFDDSSYTNRQNPPGYGEDEEISDSPTFNRNQYKKDYSHNNNDKYEKKYYPPKRPNSY